MKMGTGLAAVVFLVATAMAGMASGQPATRPAETVRVKTAEELLAAIGSDRTIEVAAGEYALSDVRDRKMENVLWEKVVDGRSITVRGVKNLRIVGVGPEPSHLVVRARYAYVLNFAGCEGVVLENVKLGHAPEKGGCENGVVGLQDCRNTTLRKCDLYGCGTEALSISKSEGVKVEDSLLHDCSYGILTIRGSKNIQFTRTRMFANEEFWGLVLDDSENIALTDCTIEKNTASEALIQASSCSNIALKGCTIRENTARALTDNPDAIKREGGKLEANSFPKGG